jgi:hypothetical protein
MRHRSRLPLHVLLMLAAVLFTMRPAAAQTDESTFTGTVASSTRNTLVVRNTEGQHRLFVFDRGLRRPAAIPVGSQVRITYYAGDDPGVLNATAVTVVQAAPAAGAGGAQTEGPVVPPEVRRTERAIARQARRYQAGVRAGVGLDPELVLLGVHAQVGPFFNPDIFLRPNVEFAFGEVTALFGLNLEAIYRLPISTRSGRWSAYVGGGPGFNLIHQNFEREEGGDRIDFGDFKSDTGLNILGGLRFRSGVFTELKTSVYANSAPTLRLIVGYNF